MKQLVGDVWDWYDRGAWLCVTTNKVVKRNGELVMGAGIALQAKQRFPHLPKQWGPEARQSDLLIAPAERLIGFPTKDDWRWPSDPALIELSARALAAWLANCEALVHGMVMPRPGCGNGGLMWSQVEPILDQHLDERITVLAHPTQVSNREPGL